MFPSLLPLAIALLLSLAAGRTASRIGVPRVSIYLIAGMLLGPHVGMLVVPEGEAARAILLGPGTHAALHAVEQLAIGFILFGIGSQFQFATFRRVGPRVLRDLVVASDLATALPDPLAPDASLAEALGHMDARRVHSWPVVADGHLVGVVRRSDVYRLVRRDVRRGR